MRIGFDAFPLANTFGGIGTYVRGLLAGLSGQIKNDLDLVAYIPLVLANSPGFQKKNLYPSVTFQPVSFCDFWLRGRLDRLDLYHGTNFKLQTKGRQGKILTIHDLWLDRNPQYSKKFFGQRLSFLRTRRRVNEANHVIAVSDFTAQEICKFYGVSSKKITVIHHGVASNFFLDQDPLRFSEVKHRLALPHNPYILFVGGCGPRKNHQTVFRAYAQEAFLYENFNLVVVGNPAYGKSTIWDCAQECGISSRIHSLSSTSVDDLRVLYSHAELFVFPSKYEGFGFPVLEAMACGVPVVTSNTSSIPEVAGSAAMLVDPESVEKLALAMTQVLREPSLKAELREKGLNRAGNFTWEKTSTQTLELYETLVKH